ncbi:hypothetical protein [Mycobacterium uberis]|nr:hypothetical protein [Mycobacterium uberis]
MRLRQRFRAADFFVLMRKFGDGSGRPLHTLRQVLAQISVGCKVYETA